MESVKVLLIIYGGGFVFCALGYITFRWALKKGWISLRLMALIIAIIYLAFGVVSWEAVQYTGLTLISAILASASIIYILFLPKTNPSLWEMLKLAGVKW